MLQSWQEEENSVCGFFVPRVESCSGSHFLFVWSAVVVKQAEGFWFLFFLFYFIFGESILTLLQDALSVKYGILE